MSSPAPQHHPNLFIKPSSTSLKHNVPLLNSNRLRFKRHLIPYLTQTKSLNIARINHLPAPLATSYTPRFAAQKGTETHTEQ